MITVTYDEQHAGITSAGVASEWFKRTEPFAPEIYGDAFVSRADAFARQLTREPARYRNIEVSSWIQVVGPR